MYASPGVFDTVFKNPIPAFAVAKDFSSMMRYSTTGWMDHNAADGYGIDPKFSMEKWFDKEWLVKRFVPLYKQTCEKCPDLDHVLCSPTVFEIRVKHYLKYEIRSNKWEKIHFEEHENCKRARGNTN